MHRKKMFTKLLAFSFAASIALTGCSSSTSSDKSKTSDNSNGSSSPIVLKFAAQADSTPATKKLIEAYNQEQHKYKVEWTQMTNDSAQMHDQLLTSLSSGSSDYDVISMDVVWAGEFAGAGYLQPIDLQMNKDGLKKTDYNAGSMASGNLEGKQYTLPFFPDLGILYYRKDIVSKDDAAKLESGNYTYNDLYTMSQKYTGKSNTKYGFVYQSKQYEGLTVNATEFSKSYQDVKGGLETMYKFTQAPFEPKDLLNYMEGETATAFNQGNAVFARNWPYEFGMIKGKQSGVTVTVDQVGVAPLPNGDSVGGWLLGINKNSKHADGAWDFIKFAAGENGQKVMSIQGGYLPGYNALLNNDEVKNANALLSYPGFQKALSSTIARPVSPEYSKTSDTIQVAAHKYLSSGSGIDDAVKTIEDAVKGK
ncbi:extracellular solute-binding protein [Bacillus sp. BRMEA1]|uniref:extracellular solute-binding protein n=1 Tax=Neobacillus endophyticus TaxID=2738405 RepID=UPI001566D228|nr:extracellular solute-binding protein [Neobacillus endophyticus]NRD76518.1 extracellular solute-binding protein [Neobacillus endophyticus]